MWSCSDDDNPAKPKDDAYKCLEAVCQRDNVLFNLQTAYNDRNINRYDELLDADFTFFFSPADVQNGVVSSEYWSRAAEINASKNIFDPNYSNPNQPPAVDIDLSLVYPSGDDQWTQMTPEDQVKYPGETWYQKIVTYNIVIKMPGDFQYAGLNKQADFTLRVATKDSKQYWQIVIWRDDVGAGFRDLVDQGRTGGVVEQSTWGRMKALFGD